MLYPDWQWKYWLRSIFIPLKTDFVYDSSPVKVQRQQNGRKGLGNALGLAAVTSGLGIALAVGVLVGSNYDVPVGVQNLGLRGNDFLRAGLRSVKSSL